MTPQENPIIGAVVRQDGSLDPVRGADPSKQGTYRELEPIEAEDELEET